MHDHHGPPLGTPLAGLAVLAVVAGYLAVAARLRSRGDAWPWARDACFLAGGAALIIALYGGRAGLLPPRPFSAHMAQHLLAGMAGPLLLVLGRPVTLAFRTLPPGRPRRTLLQVVHSRPARWAAFPPIAALLDMGGLWLLYRTPLLAATHEHPALHALVHAHVVLAGTLFAFAVCQLDPVRRRWGLPLRGGTLLIAGAAHAVLAKSLYAAPPPGTAFTAADLHAAAQLMYYGGDAVELGLAVVLAVQWYRRRAVSRVACPSPVR